MHYLPVVSSLLFTIHQPIQAQEKSMRAYKQRHIQTDKENNPTAHSRVQEKHNKLINASMVHCGLINAKVHLSIIIQVQVPVVLCGYVWWCVGAQADALTGRIECLAEYSLLHQWRAQLQWVASSLKICHGRFHKWPRECALVFTLPNWLCCHVMQRDLY